MGEKMYSREEVIILLNNLAKDEGFDGINIDKWIEENL
jgi:hypothetical protein